MKLTPAVLLATAAISVFAQNKWEFPEVRL